jgi:hypothetical protein
MPPKPDVLRKLEEKSRRSRAALQRNQQADSRAQERQARRNLLAALVGGGNLKYVALAIAAIVLGPLAAFACLELGLTYVAVPLFIGVAALVGFVALRGSHWLIAREHAYLDALPFPVSGYFEVLSGFPYPVIVALEFSGDAPPRDAANDVAALLTAGRFIRHETKVDVIEADDHRWQLHAYASGDRVDTTVLYRGLLRRLLSEGLAPLAVAFPIAQVTIRPE